MHSGGTGVSGCCNEGVQIQHNAFINTIDGDVATIGMTDYAQGELGDIVYVDISSVGQTVEHGQVFGTVEAVKTVSELFMPVSGTIIEMNANLDAAPESVNSDPYGSGWMIKVELSDPSELDGLLTAAQYSELVSA